jgi:hypothetical protein
VDSREPVILSEAKDLIYKKMLLPRRGISMTPLASLCHRFELCDTKGDNPYLLRAHIVGRSSASRFSRLRAFRATSFAAEVLSRLRQFLVT